MFKTTLRMAVFDYTTERENFRSRWLRRWATCLLYYELSFTRRAATVAKNSPRPTVLPTNSTEDMPSCRLPPPELCPDGRRSCCHTALPVHCPQEPVVLVQGFNSIFIQEGTHIQDVK